ncbi:insecticidal delta-endotoxin Cry8Ea1 family protein, partial [Bacillus toyonensis]
MAYQPRYPLTQSPASELQGMNYKEWINRCEDQELGELFVDSNAVRNAVVIGAKITATIVGIAFPPLKIPAQIISMLIPVLWPKEAGPPGTAEAQFTWEQMMSAVEEMIDQKIEIAVKDRAIETLQILQSRIRDYQQALCNLQTDPDNERFKEDVRREFNDAEDQAKAAIIQFMNPKYKIPLLADYAQAANLHLLLLRDVVQYGESWGFSFVEVQQYYFNNQIGNLGMKQLLATYTDHCVRYYNEGLQKRYDTGNWNTFNDYRRNMTLMVMDVVSFWPTYDPILYKVPTKSQLTRIVYTPLLGRADNFPGIPAPSIGEKESTLTQPPRLFTWLRELSIGESDFPYYFSTAFSGGKQIFQNTMNNNLWEEPYKGSPGNKDTQTLIIPASEVNDDVWRIVTYYTYHSGGALQFNTLLGWDFSFTKSLDQRLYPRNIIDLRRESSGLPCGGSSPVPCDPCNSVAPCSSELPNPTNPCDDKALYSHRFAYMGAGLVTNNPLTAMTYVSYGWTHVSADANNLIDAERITQIPAVKGSEIEGTAKVIKGPGSTGGDLVQLDYRGRLKISTTAPVRKGYQLRIRYATASTAEIHVNRASIREDDSSNEDYYHFEFLRFWCKNRGFMKTEQKIPNGIELYAVK